MGDKIRRGDIHSRLVAMVAEAVNRPPGELRCDIPVSKLDVDSVAVVDIAKQLETWLGMEIEPTIAWDYPTIDGMASYLEEQYLAQHSAR